MSLKSSIKYLGELLLSCAIFVTAMPFGGLLATLLGFQQPIMPEGSTGSTSILYLALERLLFALALSLLAVGIAARYMARTLTLGLFGWCVYSQGLGMLPKFFTGWLWGSVRYATGMIIERATGVSVSEYLERKKWQPLGMEFDGSWSLVQYFADTCRNY